MESSWSLSSYNDEEAPNAHPDELSRWPEGEDTLSRVKFVSVFADIMAPHLDVLKGMNRDQMSQVFLGPSRRLRPPGGRARNTGASEARVSNMLEGLRPGPR
jgi:hypothetical protein